MWNRILDWIKKNKITIFLTLLVIFLIFKNKSPILPFSFSFNSKEENSYQNKKN